MTPTATFYTHVTDTELFACRLSRRAAESGSRILLWTDDETRLMRLDAALWSFEAESFLPHEIWQPSAHYPGEPAVLLACDNVLPQLPQGTVVLNLSEDFWHQAPTLPVRILEIVGTAEYQLAAARHRFAAYRRHGFAIEHHNMQGKA